MVLGGQDPNPEATELETGAAAYDPEADEWRTLEDMPSPQTTLVTAWTGDVVYILGGGLPQPPPPEEGEQAQEAEDGPAFLAYAAGADTWVTHPDPPGGPRTHHALAWTGAELVVWGGQADNDGDEAAPGLLWDPPG